MRARFLAEFTLSELRRSFAALRMTANGRGMTVRAGCQHLGERALGNKLRHAGDILVQWSIFGYGR